MSKIIQLSPQLANLIAAGEVVERPASVVKELVENALDAGAKTVTVELQNGGMKLLRVQDDGCGMAPDDAETAFLRHATSKLRRKEDLEAIGTLGFRGEALAATAAVSRIDLLTRAADAETGVHLHLEAGKLLETESAGCPVGTTILVRDLFYNTPARMKFMKTDKAETAAALAAVQKQALARPDCAFRFLADGEEKLRSPGDGRLHSAIYAVLGRQTAAELLPVDSSWERLRLTGFVGKPSASRGSRSYEIFFVNGRYVKSKTLTAALEEAYRSRIMAGRFPTCVLHLELPLSMVDVNVHPAKTEIKFLNEREAFDCVHYGVLAALNKAAGGVSMQLPHAVHSGRGEGPESGRDSAGAAYPQKDVLPAFRGAAPSPAGNTGPRDVATPAPAGNTGPRDVAAPSPAGNTGPRDGAAPSPAGNTGPRSVPASAHTKPQADQTFRQMSAETYRAWLQTLEGAKAVQPDPKLVEAVFSAPLLHEDVLTPRPAAQDPVPLQYEALPSEAAEQPAETLLLQTPAFRVVGEVLRTYIVVEQDDAVLLIDKHAAHERMNYERLLAQGVQVTGQQLLTPCSCMLDPEEAALLTQHKTLLDSLGYDFDELGDGALLLRQIPADLEEAGAISALSEIAQQLARGGKETPEALRMRLLETMACKAAIKGGWRTAQEELEYLAGQVLTRDDLKTCPHGRPICVTLTRRQLEKQFKRIP